VKHLLKKFLPLTVSSESLSIYITYGFSYKSPLGINRKSSGEPVLDSSSAVVTDPLLTQPLKNVKSIGIQSCPNKTVAGIAYIFGVYSLLILYNKL